MIKLLQSVLGIGIGYMFCKFAGYPMSPISALWMFLGAVGMWLNFVLVWK